MSLEKQLKFIVEIDKLKKIIRRNYIADASRLENSAEHSWHIAMMAISLSKYANNVDLLKVLKMLLIHDIVEIDAGDTYIHDEKGLEGKKEREQKAAQRIFSLLPKKQKEELIDIWYEFENSETKEAQFALAMDRLHPFLLHLSSKGMVWQKNGISKEQIIKIMKPLDPFPKLKKYLDESLEEAVKNGWLK